MTLEQYMNKTEYAVRQLFDSLKYYQQLIKESVPPSVSFSTKLNATKEEKDKAYQLARYCILDFQEKQDYANKKSDEYLAIHFAHATICGSILQIAHMAISSISKYDEDCLVLTNEYVKYGIGRKIRNIPIGLIIYAGRNQYNHWDEESRQKVRKLFDLISTFNKSSDYKDPSFNLDNEYLKIYSHNILELIGWKTYKDYENDITAMLSEFR
jgi:hypothetical protein